MSSVAERASEPPGDRPPPGAWAPARAAALTLVVRPLERFLRVQTASGIVLMLAAVVALGWANSPWHASYERLWRTPLTLGVGELVLRGDLHFLINDVLMVVFFFVVGLEIRRELHAGELSDPRRAALPAAAALGGMLAPALIYFSLNHAGVAHHGWGVPTATDIAFAVGVLALLGRRVPPALRVLLLALAIIDDIGAIVIIALFYSSGVQVLGLVVAAGGAAGVWLMQRLGLRRAALYVLPGAIIWGGLLASGVHPTIAGVALGLLTPVQAWFGRAGFVAEARAALADFAERAARPDADAHELTGPLERLARARREALAPVVRLESALNPWVAFGIMPLFALANAGVRVGSLELGIPSGATVLAGVALGLFVGKPVGIVLMTWLTVRVGLCSLPRGVDTRGIVVVGMVAGVGFTMALFIAELAFADASHLGIAKLAILLGSLAAGVVGLVAGRRLLPVRPLEGAAASVDEAEQSTEL